MVTAFAVGEFAITNWATIAELAVATVKLAFVSFGGAVEHLFTEEIPGWTMWVADNMGDIFFTALDYTLTLFINLGKNIRAVWQAVLDFFSTGSFDVDWTPLLEGARSTISKMPNIPERVIGDVEKQLASEVLALETTLGNSFDDIVAERLGNLESLEASEQNSIAAMGDLPSTDAASVVAEAKKAEQKFAGVQAQGSSEAFSLLAKSGQQMPQVKEQKETNKILRGMAKVMERQKERNESLQEVGIA